MCGGEVGTIYLMKERKERFGRINRNHLCPGLRWMWLHMASFVCPCTTECRESKSLSYLGIGRGLAPTGDHTTNCAQQEWVDASILHLCLNRHRPSLTERRQPCQSRAIEMVGISRVRATQGAGTMDNCAWNDTTQWHSGLSPDNRCLHCNE